MNDGRQQAKRVGIVLPEEVYRQGKQAAERERRSFSNYVVALIDRATRDKQTELPLSTEKEVA